ncbi:MAG TPA: chloride channel protein [Candidatus Sulfotelmatobacter sp.]|nr:chloride channel protein [Candidatus Sulfotelmatobacter sp.]
MRPTKAKVSIFRLRLGLFFFILWWIPIYLTVPSLADLLNLQTTQSKHILFVCIIVAQTIFGFLGLILVGKELSLTLKRVSYRRMPGVIWRMVIRGDTTIPADSLKPKKTKKEKAKTGAIAGLGAAPTLSQALKSKQYLSILALAVVIGIPISAAAYYFLVLIGKVQNWVFVRAPNELGFHGTPTWWVILPLAFAAIFVSLTIKYLPGKGGHVPAEGFKAGGIVTPEQLFGVFFAALASIGLGAVIGPEAPLIALGSGLGYLSIKLIKKDVPQTGAAIVAATGSFAAISTLVGSPLIGAFLLLEAAGLSGDTTTIVLMPGLLAAGIGSLIFTGLNSLTGLGAFSLAIPNLPRFSHPDVKELLWAVVVGAITAVLGVVIMKFGLKIFKLVSKRLVLATFIAGLLIAGLAIAYSYITGHSPNDVLFSGQSSTPYFVSHAAEFSIGALLLLLLTKGVAYGLSLGSFRGGPIFPSIFLGCVLGIAMSHLPGLPLVPAIAMGMGGMIASVLRLPFSAALFAVILSASDALAVTPLVIVAVVVSFVLASVLSPKATTTG